MNSRASASPGPNQTPLMVSSRPGLRHPDCTVPSPSRSVLVDSTPRPPSSPSESVNTLYAAADVSGFRVAQTRVAPSGLVILTVSTTIVRPPL